jgi:hypothetical protein
VIGRGGSSRFPAEIWTPPMGRRRCGSEASTARDKGESGRGGVVNKGGKADKASRAAEKFSWVRARVRGRVKCK